jgi:hypothetical protein
VRGRGQWASRAQSRTANKHKTASHVLFDITHNHHRIHNSNCTCSLAPHSSQSQKCECTAPISQRGREESKSSTSRVEANQIVCWPSSAVDEGPFGGLFGVETVAGAELLLADSVAGPRAESRSPARRRSTASASAAGPPAGAGRGDRGGGGAGPVMARAGGGGASTSLAVPASLASTAAAATTALDPGSLWFASAESRGR